MFTKYLNFSEIPNFFWEFRICVLPDSTRYSIIYCTQQKTPRWVSRQSVSTSNMDWENKKREILAMKPDEKRKSYIGKYTELTSIPTWADFFLKKGKNISPKIEILPENNINQSKNSELANKISVFFGDITTLEIDTIVNAANSSLRGGGGVDGAIHSAAGKSLVAECITLGGCPTGEAKITGGYNLPAKYVIHTVGPQGQKPDLLKNCYENSLNLLLEHKLKTIAFPCISTGIYGYPNLPAARVAAYTVRKFLEDNADNVERIIFCLFLDQDKSIYEGILQSYFPVS